jgi:hypothetical protein
MCFNPSPVRRVPSPNRYMAVARFCFCKNNKRTIDRCFAVLGKLRGGPQNLTGFAGKPPDFTGLTPKNRTPICAPAPLFSTEKHSRPRCECCAALGKWRAYNRKVVALAAALAVETVAFFAILARLVQVQVPALSFSALAHTQRPEGGGPQVFPGFGDKLPNFRGLTPKKPDSNFAC